MPTPKLILASQSRGRAYLLDQAGYTYAQAAPAFADPPQPEVEEHVSIQRHAMELAVRKAESMRDILGDYDPSAAIILSADTMCVGVDGRIVSQPSDVEDARAMIKSFVHATHDVVTGVAMLRIDPADTIHYPRGGELVTFEDTVPVTFGKLDDEAIDEYLATGQWRGKAGAYNLFDRQSAGWPITIPEDADATTVVGLPMRKVSAVLARWGVKPNLEILKSGILEMKGSPRTRR
ncbi:MAG: Maf family protein [Phycisphaeraceae bacterium]